ncbi:MAG: hypothetical protein LBR06_03390 [Bacteroidales bacterium]|jgi:hypothetical protein|nr:hypothetical protein [Bacteroidales bacterium]
MNLNLTDLTTVYIACLPHNTSGGPELLHQLAWKLNRQGIRACMFYLKRSSSPVADIYRQYVDSYVFEVEDSRHNILIVPEGRTYLLPRYRNIQKVIWWLSVDNYFISRNFPENRLRRVLRLRRYFMPENPTTHDDITLHLVQSKYAADFLDSYAINNYVYLTDYLRADFFARSRELSGTVKEDIVIYNPRKGFKFTEKLIAACPDIHFTAIEGMTPSEVVMLMAKSKVYIDFGNHPGRDRLPREAAMMLDCVITGKRGAAGNDIDTPIPPEFKFDDRDADVPAIREALRKLLANYAAEVKKFAAYRATIQQQEHLFDSEINAIFTRHVKKKLFFS